MKFRRSTILILTVTLTLFAFNPFQLSVNAQRTGGIIVQGETAMAWMTYGELVRFRAFNPSQTVSGRANDPIDLTLKVFDEHGALLKQLPLVTIPPGEFRWLDVKREDLSVSGDSTGRVQIRTQPIWGLRTNAGIKVPTSLDLVDQATGAGTFRFLIVVEALP